jgi:YrbI family 3-deoxy-D-manno-octulosonate 8-phosphate phosphatase
MVEGDLEILAIIPARGGSKTVPRKNIRELAGHPLLTYSIAAGLQAASVNRVIVSTDDEEIAAVAMEYGAEVPFMRPNALAQDDTTDLPVFKHVLSSLKQNESYQPDIVVQLRPTSPLRPPELVDQSIQLLVDHPEASSVRGVIPSGQNPYKMWRIHEAGNLAPLLENDFEEPFNMPRQKLPQTYWQTGHIDAIRRETIEAESMSGTAILPLIIDPNYAVDIDTERDHERAEWLIRQGELPIVKPGITPRNLPGDIQLVLLDFDGVLTDNRVWVDANGKEWVAANRSDGWGIAQLKAKGVRIIVLSTETNPVVTARCDKLGLEVVQGLEDKSAAVEALLKKERIDPATTIFVGNDENDLPAFPLVACAVVVNDAHPSARSKADIILKERGGHGAVRELCDLIIREMEA